jgi:hypothetical protein
MSGQSLEQVGEALAHEKSLEASAALQDLPLAPAVSARPFARTLLRN